MLDRVRVADAGSRPAGSGRALLRRRAPAGARVELRRKGEDAAEAGGVGRAPLADRLAVDRLARGLEREGRRDAAHEVRAGPERERHLAGHAILRAGEQRLGVAAGGLDELALVDPVAVAGRDLLLQALLPLG